MANHSKINPSQVPQVISLYLSGMSCLQVGKVFGVSSGAIVRVLNAHGVQRRNHSESITLRWQDPQYKTKQHKARLGARVGVGGKVKPFDTVDEFEQYKRDLRKRNYDANKEKLNAQRRNRYANEPEYRSIKQSQNKRSREKHKTRIQERHQVDTTKRQKRLETDPDFREHYRFMVIKRRARKRALPDDLTREQWVFALQYFDYRCAVCGRTEDLWTRIVKDHWVPLTSGGGTTASNIVPLCHSKKGNPAGEVGCNSSKHNKEPMEWLVERFGQRKAKKIITRIETYFQAVSNGVGSTKSDG